MHLGGRLCRIFNVVEVRLAKALGVRVEIREELRFARHSRECCSHTLSGLDQGRLLCCGGGKRAGILYTLQLGRPRSSLSPSPSVP